MLEALGNAAEVVAGVLGISITVVAIIVELAATRYNHRITTMFISDPLSISILCAFVATAVLSFWVSSVDSEVLHIGAMIMVTASLVVLLPYFGYVFWFISPLNVINRIRRQARDMISRQPTRASSRVLIMRNIDALEDVARSAVDQGNRDIAMACVDALGQLLREYQQLKRVLSAEWYQIDDSIMVDPDFVSLEPSTLSDIQRDRLWLEVKIFRQYDSLMNLSIPRMREVANLISINMRRVATELTDGAPALLDLTVRFFNSYLRASIKSGDQRTTYYLLNQYRLMAEHLIAVDDLATTRRLAQHLRSYGTIAHETGQSFLAGVIAWDMMQLVERSYRTSPEAVDALLHNLLELDLEIRSEDEEANLLEIRRAQIQLATFFLEQGDETRARLIADDLKAERRDRLLRLKRDLETEDRDQYWEFTDRGSVNFRYLAPHRRKHLDVLFSFL